MLNSVNSFSFDEDTSPERSSFLPLNHIFERMVSIYIYRVFRSTAENPDTIGENLKEVQPNLFSTAPPAGKNL